MLWWQNIPFFSILLCLLSGAVCSVLPPVGARRWARGVLSLCLLFSGLLVGFLLRPGTVPFHFMMGHFPAPWGNELRCGILEALLACLFPFVMLCALLSGGSELRNGTGSSRESVYHSLCMLLMAALLSLIYSNDLFTCYVFLEITTLSACGLIIFRNSGSSLSAGMRYMVLNMLGSGLFLLGVVLLYDLTGHLLMEPLRDSIGALSASGTYSRSLTVIIALITVGLCVKSALFPFHAWVPDAYSSGVSPSNAILSALVSKGYIVLLLKIHLRVFGWSQVSFSRVDLLLLAFAWSGMLFGSLGAILTSGLSRMTAWSSVSQIGYIYLGLALGPEGGFAAAVFHLAVHACSKSLLFLSGEKLKEAAGSGRFPALAGAARGRPLFGACWTIAAFSMVGLPFTGGLISKLLLGSAALEHSLPVAAVTLAVLALSTLLNVLYFLRTVLVLWSPGAAASRSRVSPAAACACCALGLAVIFSFLFAGPVLEAVSAGLAGF